MLLLFGGQFAFLDLNVVLLSQRTQSIAIGAVVNLHDEPDGISALAAAEALEYAFARRHGERACTFGVERTETNQVSTAAFERHVVLHHLFNLGGAENLIYGLRRDHKFLLVLGSTTQTNVVFVVGRAEACVSFARCTCLS